MACLVVALPGQRRSNVSSALKKCSTHRLKNGILTLCRVSWPPSSYPDAKVEDVEYHFIPRFGRQHFVLFHLFKSGTDWQATFFSSKSGYTGQMEEHWPLVAAGLMRVSPTWRPGAIEPRQSTIQPMQLNSNDCGVLTLCTARWIVEGWSLNTLKGPDCPILRERMIAELDGWWLSRNPIGSLQPRSLNQ